MNSRTPRLKREEPKSRAGYRQVPIVEALAIRLDAHLATLGPNDEGAVFASPVGTWMSKSNFYRDAWKPTRTAAGREDLTFHDLRHTAASLLLTRRVASDATGGRHSTDRVTVVLAGIDVSCWCCSSGLG